MITDPYQIARDGLVCYAGDRNPLDHDGYWYATTEWPENGYADAVRVTCMPDGPDGAKHVIVERVTINKPSNMKPALDCLGLEGDDRDNPHAQIEACMSYGHVDPNDSDYREPSSFSFVVPDYDEEEYKAKHAASWSRYCRIHGATMATDEDIFTLLYRLVAVDGCG